MKKRIIAALLAACMLFATACSATPAEEDVAEAQVLTGTAKGYGGELKVEVTLEGEDIVSVDVV